MKHLIEKKVLGPLLEMLTQVMPRDNLLSSASLELFEFVKKENIKEIVKHLVESHRDLLTQLSYIPTFKEIILRYDQTKGYTANMEYFLEREDDIGRKPPANARFIEHIAVDPVEEEYWDAADPDEEEEANGQTRNLSPVGLLPSTPSKPLVDYLSDEENEENAEPEIHDETKSPDAGGEGSKTRKTDSAADRTPPERLSEKRRREEDDDDELDKLMQNKRRNSSSSAANSATKAGVGRRRGSFTPGSGNGTSKKIAISLSPALRLGGEGGSDVDS